MKDYSHFRFTIESYIGAHPRLPKYISKRARRSFRLWSFDQGVLLLQNDGRYVLLDDRMHPEFWGKWFEHREYGLLCYAFQAAFYFAGPIASGNIFHVDRFDWDHSVIRGVNLVCTRCNSVTRVNSIWFKHFRYNLDPLLCCHRRFVMIPYWKIFFWSMAFYNSLIFFLNRADPRVLIATLPRQQWYVGRLRDKLTKKNFSGLGLKVLRNGKHIEVPGFFPIPI